jgi:hypothetical protein
MRSEVGWMESIEDRCNQVKMMADNQQPNKTKAWVGSTYTEVLHVLRFQQFIKEDLDIVSNYIKILEMDKCKPIKHQWSIWIMK